MFINKRFNKYIICLSCRFISSKIINIITKFFPSNRITISFIFCIISIYNTSRIFSNILTSPLREFIVYFKNKNLTLKAKGLLSLMLSLPDDWNYNMQGLATLSRDGIDSVRSAIKELEHHGYVERHRLRNEYGFYGDTEYIIREVPLGEEND